MTGADDFRVQSGVLLSVASSACIMVGALASHVAVAAGNVIDADDGVKYQVFSSLSLVTSRLHLLMFTPVIIGATVMVAPCGRHRMDCYSTVRFVTISTIMSPEAPYGLLFDRTVRYHKHYYVAGGTV
ncbi:hypothetical protein BJ166DRAFT_497335 [Pestalotiopsis sp. NC0098]|nr:hypothetical protein BJ166DRAFT_497335 [Pestalotiopsis sp. NC0098]